MKEVQQSVVNSQVEYMAGGDVNITVIHGKHQPFPRSHYVRDILQLRASCKHLEFIINTHAQKAYGSRFFKEMSDEQLTEMHKFVMELKLATQPKRWVWWQRVVGWVRKCINLGD